MKDKERREKKDTKAHKHTSFYPLFLFHFPSHWLILWSICQNSFERMGCLFTFMHGKLFIFVVIRTHFLYVCVCMCSHTIVFKQGVIIIQMFFLCMVIHSSIQTKAKNDTRFFYLCDHTRLYSNKKSGDNRLLIFNSHFMKWKLINVRFFFCFLHLFWGWVGWIYPFM